METLSWGLTVATKDRLDALRVCVLLALQQSRLPSEIIIVDASQSWRDHAQVIGDIVAAHPDIRFDYIQADQPSLTVQRTQAVAAARADVLFMIDDDSFMHPDCAERIMTLYEADTKQHVAGIQASPTPHLPEAVQTLMKNVQAGRKQTGAEALRKSSRGAKGSWRRWILRHIFLMSTEEAFIPYDGQFHQHSVPEALRDQPVVEARLFVGFRMTYRRQAVLASPFDGLLRYYCPGEDADASYRISRHGAILTATEAKLHHYTAASGRLDRRATTMLSALNQAVLLHRYSKDRNSARRRYFALMRRRAVAETLKDLLSRRFSLPQARGLISAWTLARRIFAMSPEALEVWYPGAQENLIKGHPLTE